MSKLKIYSDGASRGNPGEAGIGVVIYSETGEILAEIAEYIGVKTNNVAEYQALIRALDEALVLGGTEIQVFADSELMVKQMRGDYKVKNPGLQPLYQKAKLLSLKFSGFQINHVRREQNKEADKLANEGIDNRSNRSTNQQKSKADEQVIIAFKEPSLSPQEDLAEDKIVIAGKSIALSKIELQKGKEQTFLSKREQICYLLQGQAEFEFDDQIEEVQSNEAIVIKANIKYQCRALIDSLILISFSLPENRF